MSARSLARRRAMKYNASVSAGPTATLVGSEILGTGNVSSVIAALTQAVPAGATLLACIKTGGGFLPTGVSDSKSNSYAKDVQENTGGPVASIYRAHITTPLTTSDTVTVAAPSEGNLNLVLIMLSGLTNNTLDKTATTSGSSTTLTVGLSSNTTVASEIAVSVLAEGGSPPSNFSVAPSTGWTNQTAGITPNLELGVATEVLSVVGEPSCTWTPSTTGNSMAAMVATYS